MLKNYLSKLLACLAVLSLTTLTVGAQSALQIDAPASIAGSYATSTAFFSGSFSGESGDLVLVDDGDDMGGTTSVSDGCEAIINDVNGKIALIDRGACGFTQKAANAEAAGAIAIVVCNNVAGDSPFMMLGNALGAVTVPVLMLDFDNCATIKTELANGVTATMVAPAAGETCTSAIPGVQGVNNAGILDAGFGTVFNGATHGLWYTYTTEMEGVLNINSCGGGADTRLIVMPGTDCGGVSDAILAGVFLAAVDDCDDGNGNIVASDVSFLVGAGETYYIHWDDAQSGDAFTFTIGESPTPTEDVTVRVDLSNEAADNGGYIAGEFNNWMPEAMVDEGDGVYAFTISALAGTPMQYKFLNGPDGWETGANLDACAVDDGMGNINRAITVPLGGANLNAVCFESCDVCPPPACSNPDAVICDDFEMYTAGDNICGQAAFWGVWGVTCGLADDAPVSDAQAASGANSMYIPDNGSSDVILKLGDVSEGRWKLSWKMYIPTGKVAYYNIQETEAPGTAWNLNMHFGNDATGATAVFGEGLVAEDGSTFTYPEDEWFDVAHYVDLDAGQIRILINGQVVSTHAYGGTMLGGIDFFSINADNQYYVDDVEYVDIQEPDCIENALICDGLEFYDDGATSGGKAPWWTTWSGDHGTTEDGIITSEIVLDGNHSMKIEGQNGPQDVLLLLGNQTSGRWAVRWDMYIPAGSLGYYNVQEDEMPGVAWNLNVQMNGDGTGDADGDAFTYPEGQWFEVFHFFDLDGDAGVLIIDNQEVRLWDYPGQLGAIDLFATNNGPHLFYLDNFMLVQLPDVAGDFCNGAVDVNDLLGAGVGNTNTSSLYDNNNALALDFFDPTTGYECFGEPDGGGASPSLENTLWFTFTGDGNEYFIETVQCNATDYIDAGDTQIAIYEGSCGALTPVACNEDGPNATGTEFPAGLDFQTTDGTVYYLMVDGFLFDDGAGTIALSDGEFCLAFTQNTGASPVDVTFSVNMAGIVVDAAGVFLAGSFNGWTDGAMTETPAGSGIWSATVSLIPGNYEYKFKNGTGGWEEGIPADCSIANGNRSVDIGDTPVDLETVCFEACDGASCIDAVTEAELASAVKLSPNPASGVTNLSYNFSESTDLTIRLTNNLGQLISVNQVSNALNGNVELDLTDLAAGTYHVVLSNGAHTVAKRLVID